MRILIACECSGRVRDAFIKKGHDAMSCDILPTEKPGSHYEGDIFDVLYDGWDMMIAHPPCTYLSNAAARFLYPQGKLNQERYLKGMEAKEFFMKLLEAPINKIAVENPVQSTVFGITKCTQYIQPYWFGDPFKKKTGLWLKNLPKLEPTDIVDNPKSTKTKKGQKSWFNQGGKDRQKMRSRTFEGIANAMAEQWGH